MVRRNASLTPSLLQPVKFMGWKMHRHTCKQHVFRSYNISTFNAMRFDENPVTWECEKDNIMAWVSNFALFVVVFTWHCGSEGVNMTIQNVQMFGVSPLLKWQNSTVERSNGDQGNCLCGCGMVSATDAWKISKHSWHETQYNQISTFSFITV